MHVIIIIRRLNCSCRKRQSALHLAVSSGELEVVEYIAKHSKNDFKDNYGNTALHVATIQPNSLDILRYLSDINPTVPNNRGDTAFHMATGSIYDINVERMVLEFSRPGCKFNVNVRNSRNGDTALHQCARRGNWQRVEQLIEVGADLAAQNTDGNTALHVVVEQWVEKPGLIDELLQVISIVCLI